jgi:hypothetical protein
MALTRIAPVALLVAFVLATACGDDNDGDSGVSDSPTPVSSLSQARVSLPDGTFLTAYGDGEATFPSDQPGLAAGDFNGDGVDDFAVGARFADPGGREDAGEAYLVFGSGDLGGEIDFAAGEQDISISGNAAADGLGFAAASGDLNGDGTDDLVLGAPFASADHSKTGAAYVFFGPLAASDAAASATDADITLSGPASGTYFGDSLAIGDINADGTDDLLAGATFATNSAGVPAGAVFAFFGRGDWPAEVASAQANASFFGAEQFDELGDFVTAGDINGDGADDVIATAEAADGPDNTRNTAGEVHVFHGGPEVGGAHEIATEQPNISVYGAAANDTLGFALAAADLDADGDDDLAMSAHLATPSSGVTSAGIVYVLPGSPALSGAIDLAQPPADIAIIAGTDPGGLFATSLATFGTDQPGLILGGNLVDTAAQDAGAVYVLPVGLPASGDVTELTRVTYTGREPSDRVGSNTVAGDFNDDGNPDLAIVAELAAGPDASRPQAGRVYLVSP